MIYKVATSPMLKPFKIVRKTKRWKRLNRPDHVVVRERKYYLFTRLDERTILTHPDNAEFFVNRHLNLGSMDEGRYRRITFLGKDK